MPVLALAPLVPALAYLLLWPSPIDPKPLNPKPDPSGAGPFVVNQDLAAARHLPAFGAAGPEDAAFDADGLLYTGLGNGDIVRVDPKSGEAVLWANTGGRPLGVAFRGEVLYVADAERGLLRVVEGRGGEGVRRIERVIETVDGEPFRYADAVHVDSQSALWITSPSTRWPLSKVRYEGMETRPTGRLIRHDPSTGETTVKLNRLLFANGVAMSPEEDYVLVSEWSAYRIARLWLKGPRAGTRDVFYDNLPGFPDNLSLDADGFFWVGLVVPRSPALDMLHPYPFLMKVLPRIPESWQPQPDRVGLLLGIDFEGRIVRNLQDSTGTVFRVTGARRFHDHLYVTSDLRGALARLPLPPAARLPSVSAAGDLR